jgi:hypothetical protein
MAMGQVKLPYRTACRDALLVSYYRARFPLYYFLCKTKRTKRVLGRTGLWWTRN